MALANAVTGPGILVSRVARVHYSSWYQFPRGRYRVEKEEEVREWVALTQAAALNFVNANVQPPHGSFSYSMTESNRIVGAYTVQRALERETHTWVTN